MRSTKTKTKPKHKADLTPSELAAVIAAAREAKSTDPDEQRRRLKRGRMRYRLRRQARPHYVLAALLLAASATRITAHILGTSFPVVVTIAAVTTTALTVAAMIMRNKTYAQKRRWLLAAAVASVWLITVAGIGFSWEAVAVLLLAGYAFALPWWRKHRIPNPDTVPIDGPDADFTVPGLWQANIGGKSGGTLPNSYLTDQREIKHGKQFSGQLQPGKHSIDNARGALPLIASGLRMDTDQIVIDRHTTGDASRFMLTVVTHSPIAKPVAYPGPQYHHATGTIALGPWADGEGYARWRVYTDDSIWGGVLIGGPGSGKSRMVDNLAISTVDSDSTVLLYGDPQHGSSSKNLAKYATWSARGMDEIATMLRALWRACDLRSKENALLGLEGFTPTPERPGILVIIDEFHRVASDKELAILLEYVAREGRKLGIAVIALSQYAGIVTFGGNEALRSAIMAGNAAALYVASKTSGGLMAGLDFDPSKLPADRPGSAYLKGQDRSASFRGFLVDDPAYWWEQAAQPALDPVILRAFGTDFTDRAVRDEAARAALHEAVYGDGPLVVNIPRPRTDAADVEPEVMERFGTIVEFPTGLGAADLTEAQAKILTAIRDGNATPAAIRTATGYGETQVRMRVNELLTAGHITKTGRGQYAVATPAKRKEIA